jgi:hypothetical protein
MAFLVAEVAMVSNFLLHHVRGRYPGTGPRYQGWTGKLKYLWGQSYLAPSTTTGNPYTWYLFSAHGGGRLVVSKTTARGENLSATEQDAHWWLGGDIDTGR